eukprot:9480105-Pyramimonas_sp.AAC.1
MGLICSMSAVRCSLQLSSLSNGSNWRDSCPRSNRENAREVVRRSIDTDLGFTFQDLEAQDAIIASETAAPHPHTNSVALMLQVLNNTDSTAVETSVTNTFANITYGDKHRQRIINEVRHSSPGAVSNAVCTPLRQFAQIPIRFPSDSHQIPIEWFSDRCSKAAKG